MPLRKLEESYLRARVLYLSAHVVLHCLPPSREIEEILTQLWNMFDKPRHLLRKAKIPL
jgi:hypothetical protein